MSSVSVIVDTTDEFTEVMRRRLKAAVEGERDTIEVGGKLTIVTINSKAPMEPVQLVSVCNPGTSAYWGPWSKTPKRVDRQWRDAFGAPLEKAIEDATKGGHADSSPIIETVSAVLVRPDFDGRVSKRRLLIISDLLQHQKSGYSHIRLCSGDLWQSYKDSVLAREVPLRLGRVTVVIDYLDREQYRACQGERHQAFWRRLLREAGAEVSFLGLRDPPLEPSVSPPPRKPKKVVRPKERPKAPPSKPAPTSPSSPFARWPFQWQ